MDQEYEPQRDPEEQIPPVEVPIDALSAELLDAIIESFILREGTDYGSVEFSLETKLKQVRQQIEKGDVRIVFDPATESVNLMTDREFKNSFHAQPNSRHER